VAIIQSSEGTTWLGGVEAILNWVVATLAMILFWAGFAQLPESYQAKDQERILMSVAVPTGVLLVLGVSNLGRIAVEFVSLTLYFTSEFPPFIKSIVDFSNVLTLLFGGLGMLDRDGLPGMLAFISAFSGGILLRFYWPL
jgi:hypothetical protein